ncbi:MAG: phage tail sheath family protein [Butyrivibrio sp.]|nr:phage tail sheath family protein [Butyrivibrio sp.]
MSIYKHGITTVRKPTAVTTPVTSAANVTCVIGTAPINMAADPYKAANVPVVAYSRADVEAKMGWSEDFDKYTIMQSAYAAFNVFAVAPLVMINVLDPNKEEHITAVTGAECPVANKKAYIDAEGVLLDTVAISGSDSEEALELNTDYVTSFAEDGTVIIGFTEAGAQKAGNSVRAAYSKLNPEGVTYADIIGGYNASERIKKGLEVISDIYPKYGIVPGTLIAPGFSQIPAVNTALAAKSQLIYSLFSCKCISDIDCSEEGAQSIDAVKEWKNNNGYSDRRTFAVWPKVNVDGYNYYFSAQLAALLQRLAADNGGVPSESPDNKQLKISALVLEDGTEVNFDLDEANDYLNANGVISAVNIDGFLAWGNNTAVYPQSTDVVDRWVTSVMMFDYIENNFKRNFFSQVGNKIDYRAIEDVVLGENLALNGLKGSNDIAGGEISFSMDDNPIGQILSGHITFRERLATYPPMEDITNEFEFDPTILQSALEGGMSNG